MKRTVLSILMLVALMVTTAVKAQTQKLITIQYDNGRTIRTSQYTFDSIQFATLKVETIDATDITETSAVLHGSFDFTDVQEAWDEYCGRYDQGDAFGFLIGTSPDNLQRYYAGWEESLIHKGSRADSTFAITYLCQPSTTYYYRAFVRKPCITFHELGHEPLNGYDGILSDEIKSFTTPAPIENWKSIGMARYREDFVTTFFGAKNEEYEVEMERDEEHPWMLRLVDPYGEAYPNNAPGDYDTSTKHYMVINTQDPDGVYIEKHMSGMDWGYGEFMMWSYAGNYIDRGYSIDYVKSAGYAGKLEDGVITFPARTLLVGMTNYNDGGFFGANGSGKFRIVLPGYEAKEYEFSFYISKLPTYVDEGEQFNVTVDIDEWGKDLAYVKMVATLGTAQDGFDLIQAGSDDVVFANGAGTWELNATGPGQFVVVAAGYDAKDNIQYTKYLYFEVKPRPADSNTWTKLGTGTYVYSHLFEGEDSGLEYFQGKEDASAYKIEHWGMDVDFKFTWDKTTNQCKVLDQPVGYEHPSFGMVYVNELNDYAGGGYDQSYYDPATGTFHFNVVYYVSVGYFGYGEETFTIDQTRASKIKARNTEKTFIVNEVVPQKKERMLKPLKAEMAAPLRAPKNVNPLLKKMDASDMIVPASEPQQPRMRR